MSNSSHDILWIGWLHFEIKRLAINKANKIESNIAQPTQNLSWKKQNSTDFHKDVMTEIKKGNTLSIV